MEQGRQELLLGLTTTIDIGRIDQNRPFVVLMLQDAGNQFAQLFHQYMQRFIGGRVGIL